MFMANLARACFLITALIFILMFVLACATPLTPVNDRDILIRFRSQDVIQAECDAKRLGPCSAYANWGQTPCVITMRQPLHRYLNDWIREDYHCKVGHYHD